MNAKEINKNYINTSTNKKPVVTQIKTPISTPIKLDNYLNQKYLNLNISSEDNNNTEKINQEPTINKTTLSNSIDSFEENSNEVVGKILDTISKNSLSIFYDSESEFKNKIDSLNLKFYLETEKYLCNQNKKVKTQTSLFIILFKQINIYIEEIQRLNMIILTKKYKPENIIKRTDELNQKQKEFQIQENIIKALKKSQFNMENKLLQAVINENNLNKKIENLQKEIEIYKNKIISLKNNSETHTIKIEKKISNSFQNRNTQNDNEEINCNANKNCNSATISNECKSNPTNNNNINMNINVNKSIKSKSPNGYNNKEYPLKLRKIKNNISIDIKRNHSQNESKSKINNFIKSEKNNNFGKNKSKYVINKQIIKKQNTNSNSNKKEMVNLGNLITKINKIEKLSKKNSKINLDFEEKKNNIDLANNNEDIIEKNNYKKILINNKSKISKDEYLNNYTNRPRYNNTLESDLLFHSYLNNNSCNLIKQTKAKILKSDLDKNKLFNTIDIENDKEKYKNAFNCFKSFQNKNKKKKNNENNSNINKIINKSILNDLKSKSLLKNKENSNRNKYKNIINISNSTGPKKNNSNTKKKF
jgi:hypothetical protein